MDQNRYAKNNTITLLLLNLTVGFKYLKLNLCPIRRRTLFLESSPNNVNLLSLLYIFDHSVAIQLICSLTNSNRAFRFCLETSDFLHALREKRLFLFKRQLTILLLILLKAHSFLISEAV